MITANIFFLDNATNVELPCRNSALKNILGSIGILINPNALLLNNARTVKVNLNPEDSIDRQIISLINPTDTIGKLNRVCNTLNCLDYRDFEAVHKGLKQNKYSSLNHLLEDANHLKEKRATKENSR